jgi:hypothetical protein
MKRNGPNICNLQRKLVIDGETTKWTLEAKYFPAQREFRIYRIDGDITKLNELVEYIKLYLVERGVEQGTITLTL